MVLFANYKTIVVNVDGQGAQKGKNKAQGGKRVMYTSHHPCWDAKNRYGLPEELPFEYQVIAHIIEAAGSPEKTEAQKTSAPAVMPERNTEPEYVQETLPDLNPSKSVATSQPEEKIPDYIVLQQSREENVPTALLDLMIANRVTEWDVQNAVGAKGYFPSDMPIEQYPEDFVQGCLVAAWPKVYELIQKEQRELDKEIPFK